jgi:hypothetical protein
VEAVDMVEAVDTVEPVEQIPLLFSSISWAAYYVLPCVDERWASGALGYDYQQHFQCPVEYLQTHHLYLDHLQGTLFSSSLHLKLTRNKKRHT